MFLKVRGARIGRMVTDEDYTALARGALLAILDLRADVLALWIAVQKHGVSLEELAVCRQEMVRRKSLDQLREEIQALGRVDLLKALKDFSGTIQ